MKKTIKAITVALAVMLLACSVFAFGASANTEEESGAVKILAQNLYYEDLVSVLYAVDVPLDDAENVTVQYYYASNPDVKYEAVLLDTTNPNYVCTVKLDDNTEVKYPCFRTAGFAAHNFTDVVYAVAYTGDVAPTNPVYKEYSVAEYLYSRLYKDDFINKTEADGDDYTRKMHYENLMAYGETAQMLFDKEETLITDYSFVYFPEKDGILNGIADKTSGLYKNDTLITVSYSGNGSINGWYVTDYDTYSYVDTQNAELTVSGLMALSAVTGSNITTPSTNTTTTINTAAKNPVNFEDTVFEISQTSTNTDAKNDISMIVNDASSTSYVFESEIYVGEASTETAELFALTFMGNTSAGNDKLLSRIYIGTATVDGNRFVTFRENNASNSTSNYTYTSNIETNSWFTLKMEFIYTYEASAETQYAVTLNVYVNNALVSELDLKDSVDGVQCLNSYNSSNIKNDITDLNVTKVQIYYKGTSVHAYFDNVSFTQGVAAE